MNPIINPLLFYIADICNNIKQVSIGIVAFGIVVIIILKGTVNDCEYNLASHQHTPENENKLKIAINTKIKNIKRAVITVIISCIIAVFCPNSTTINKMIVANMVTPDNIEMVGDTLNNSIDIILDKIVETASKLNNE